MVLTASRGEHHHIPVPVLILHQIPMPSIDHRIIRPKIPMCKDRIARASLKPLKQLSASRHTDAVFRSGSSFCMQQIIIAVFFVSDVVPPARLPLSQPLSRLPCSLRPASSSSDPVPAPRSPSPHCTLLHRDSVWFRNNSTCHPHQKTGWDQSRLLLLPDNGSDHGPSGCSAVTTKLSSIADLL